MYAVLSYLKGEGKISREVARGGRGRRKKKEGN